MIYTYQCKDCKHVFEVVKRLAEIDKVEPCKECSGEDTERIVSAAGFTNSDSLGRRKAPEEFRDWMRTLHKNTPGSLMDVD